MKASSLRPRPRSQLPTKRQEIWVQFHFSLLQSVWLYPFLSPENEHTHACLSRLLDSEPTIWEKYVRFFPSLKGVWGSRSQGGKLAGFESGPLGYSIRPAVSLVDHVRQANHLFSRCLHFFSYKTEVVISLYVTPHPARRLQ